MKLDKLEIVSERDIIEYLIGLESLSEWLVYYTIASLYSPFCSSSHCPPHDAQNFT